MWTRIFLDETRRLRTAWRFAIFAVGFVVVNLAVGIVVLIGLAVYLAFSGQGHLLGLNNLEKLLPEWTLRLTIISAPLHAAGFLVLVVVCRRWLDRRTIASMGFVRPQRRFSSSMWGGFVIGFVPIVLTVLVIWACGGYRLAGFSCSLITVLLIPTLVLMAFVEEIVFRSYLLQNLFDIRRPVFGILFTSVLFWLIHSLNPNAWISPFIGLNLFGAGLVLALAYKVSGNIWFPTTLHLGWNLAQGVVFGVPISGIEVTGFVNLEASGAMPRWLTGGRFGPEASLPATLVEICLILLLLWMLRAQAARRPVLLAECESDGYSPDSSPFRTEHTLDDEEE